MIDTKAFGLLLKSEGGLNEKEPAEVGGVSYAGITQKTYEAWLKTNKAQEINDAPPHVRDLAGTAIGTKYEKMSPLEIPIEYGVRIDVIKAFYTDYLQKSYTELLPECLQYMHMDFFVNAGFTANKIVQRFLGVDDDGIIGRKTRPQLIEFVNAFNEELEQDKYADNNLINQYDTEKRNHYQGLVDKNPEKYGGWLNGWLTRCDHVKAELAPYFEDDEPTPSAVEDHTAIDVFNDTEDAITTPTIVVDANSEQIDSRLVALEENMVTIQVNMGNIQSALEEILKNPPKKSFF